MKSSIQFLPSLCVFLILQISAAADVDFTNNSPGYVAKVDMYTVDNGEWGVTTFSCEHYLSPRRHHSTGLRD